MVKPARLPGGLSLLPETNTSVVGRNKNVGPKTIKDIPSEMVGLRSFDRV